MDYDEIRKTSEAVDSSMREGLKALIDQNKRNKQALLFGGDEKRVLYDCFYDERLKLRRNKVPSFFIYTSFCDGTDTPFWPQDILRAKQAVSNLVQLNYLQRTNYDSQHLVCMDVGRAAEAYELTQHGVDMLNCQRPNVALHVRAWIKTLPPWLVLVGAVAGAISAFWKFSELLIDVAKALLS